MSNVCILAFSTISRSRDPPPVHTFQRLTLPRRGSIRGLHRQLRGSHSTVARCAFRSFRGAHIGQLRGSHMVHHTLPGAPFHGSHRQLHGAHSAVAWCAFRSFRGANIRRLRSSHSAAFAVHIPQLSRFRYPPVSRFTSLTC